MSRTVKCSNCNVVIDELLTYVNNKLLVIDEETLLRICVTSFTANEIKKSKSLLYDSLSTDKRKIARRNDGKESRDMQDIVSLLKSSDPDVIPKFVARGLEKLPPVTFDHLDVTKLLKDLVLMKSEIADIKSTHATSEQLNTLKNELFDKKFHTISSSHYKYRSINVNTKRGGYMDSGPFGILALDATIVDNNVADNINASSSLNCSEKSNTENVGRFEECANGSLNPNTVITTAAVTSEVAMPTTAERIERANETGLFITKQPQICLSTASAEKTLADVVKLHRPSGVTRIAEQENE